jgi:formylglycine-generating enzyme required for sulfatase activity
MLPDEWLWEWIATNGEGPGRKYPWGNDEPNAGLAHFGRTDGPTQIGNHPSREGVNDLAGNLFEWTMSPYRAGEPWYTMRGGAWCHGARLLRAAFRLVNHPSDAFSNLGFRVVVPQDS